MPAPISPPTGPATGIGSFSDCRGSGMGEYSLLIFKPWPDSG